MYWRDHDAEGGQYYRGADYILVVRAPGSCRISVPAGAHYIDVYLGKTKGSYEISGLEACGDTAPPSTFVFLPEDREREIRTTRSGWSVQLSFAPALLKLPPELEASQNGKALQPIIHAEDEGLISLANLLSVAWSTELPKPTNEQTDAIALLMSARLAQFIIAKAQSTPAKGVHSQRIQAMLDHVEKNLGEPLSLSELALVAGVSPYHFARIFREATGRSPHQYVIERRVAQAKERLLRSDDAIAAIAIDCGFGSQSHMTSVFSKMVGTTPGAVRKNAL